MFVSLSGSVAVAWIFVNEKLNKNQLKKNAHFICNSSACTNQFLFKHVAFSLYGINSQFLHGSVVQLWVIYAKVTV